MKKVLTVLMILLMSAIGYAYDEVEKILEKGVLRVGTTLDYKPFTYKENGIEKGYDIEVAKLIAKELGVKLEIVSTTWKTLLDDLKENKYDIAMGGITRTVKRQSSANMTEPYLIFGKCFLVRKGEKEKYNSLEAVDKPNVRIGVNIGGTNEIYVSEHIKNAQVIKYKNNLDVPVAVENGDVDVMITETPEAVTYQKNNHKLEGASMDKTLTKSQMGYMIRKENQHLLNTVNFILEELELRGEIEKLKVQYLK
ncbi:MAG: transporter substrate-binding domain-containing protein [Fusobacterium sp.]|nr:transporter substrate-binding domain-containing protein [Fusobacterium sp.]